jgi:hypothetical protein
VARLGAYRGIAELTALTLAAEVVDWHRFPSARAFMGFTGLIPQRVLQRDAHQARLDHQGRPRGRADRAGGVGLGLPVPARGRLRAPAPPGRGGPRHAGPVLEGIAAPPRHLQEDDRPRQAARRRGHGRRPRARRVRLGRDDQLTSVRPARRPAACRETTPRQEMTPGNVLSEPNLAVSEGHRPAHSRPAIPTREYEPGSGDSHDHAPARRPHPHAPRHRDRPGDGGRGQPLTRH